MFHDSNLNTITTSNHRHTCDMSHPPSRLLSSVGLFTLVVGEKGLVRLPAESWSSRPHLPHAKIGEPGYSWEGVMQQSRNASLESGDDKLGRDEGEMRARDVVLKSRKLVSFVSEYLCRISPGKQRGTTKNEDKNQRCMNSANRFCGSSMVPETPPTSDQVQRYARSCLVNRELGPIH